jgi:hypothetical protein
MNLEDLITNETQELITINKTGAISNIWIVNFNNLKENRDKFKDPDGTPYKFAYAEWQIIKDNGEQEWYSFIQLATKSEKTNTRRLVWNYFKYDVWDSLSLFKAWSWHWVDGESIDKSSYDVIWIFCNSKYRYHPPAWNATTFVWTPDGELPSWTKCYGQRENPSHSTWEYDIVYNYLTYEYAFRCSWNSTFMSYSYATKLSQYPAFKACSDLWNWWRLPTKVELENLYANSAKCSALGLQSSRYWSSTEYYINNARVVWMDNGSTAVRIKAYSSHVVCIHN